MWPPWHNSEQGWHRVFWSRQLNLKIARETSELWIHYLAGSLPQVGLYVVNNTCAVVKTPTPKKVSQVPSFNGEPVEPGKFYPLPFNIPTLLDIETAWELVKCLNYTKSINWFGITKAPFVEPHPCVLFELVAPRGAYQFQLIAHARVDLVGATDVNPENNDAVSPPLILIVDVK